MSHIIDISSSPEPGPSYIQPQQRSLTVKVTSKRQRTRIGPVIELTDSDTDGEVVSGGPHQRVASPKNVTSDPLSRARRTPTFAHRHPMVDGSSSLQNIPSHSKRPVTPTAKPSRNFLPSDEENEPPVPALSTLDRPLVGAIDMDNGSAPLQITQQEPPPTEEATETEPRRDPLPGYVARVLEIIPDVEPGHLLGLVTKLAPSLHDGVVEQVLHVLFEDPTYPKIDRNGKGKRKQTDEDVRGEEASLQCGSPAKKPKLDYGDENRAFQGGIHYTELALERLQISNPYVPKPYLRQLMISFNGLYAPTHLFLIEQEKRHKEGKSTARLPYVRKANPFRPSSKGKNRDLEDAELAKEIGWLQNEAEKRDRQIAEELNDEEIQDGIECACCFSTVPFDKMIQCPETHLFCTQCMSSYAETLLGEHNPNLTCIHQSGCKAAIPSSELRRFLSTKMMELWERLKQRKEVEAAGLVGLEECPFCEYCCLIENPDEKLFRCGNSESCGVVSCRGCKKVDHLPKSCKEMEEEKALDGRHAIEEAMTRALMRNCPKCQKPFVKEHGCNKMTCPNCHTLSCYICRQVITGYDHFNQLPSGQVAPTTSANAAKCLLWDPVEQRHAEEVKAAAQRALEEYKQKNPDVDEKELHVDLPPAPAAPAQPSHGMNIAMGHYAMMAQNQNQRQNQVHATQIQALQAQLIQLRHQREACQLQVQGFDAQTQLMRATIARNLDPRFTGMFVQQEADMAGVVALERNRLIRIQARIANIQAQLDRVNAAAAAAARPLAQPAMPLPFNINVNINYGRQPAEPPARRAARARR